MNEKWTTLIEEFEKNGYTPNEVQRIILFYQMTKDIDSKLKKLYEDEKNERINSDSLYSK